MKTVISITIFTLLVTGFYGFIGNLVPQKEVHPPEEVVLSADMSTEEMVVVGRSIVEGKGTCLSCHKMAKAENERFPSLDGIGNRAGTMIEGMDDIEYLAQSLYEPNSFIVESFNPGMPAVDKGAISLSEMEILAVMAYLQTLGGTATVSMETKTKYSSGEGVVSEKKTETVQKSAPLSPEEIITQYTCQACHSMDNETPLVGPSLFSVGKRLSKSELYESIVDADAVIAKGFAPGVMKSTLEGLGFSDKISSGELKSLVDYLASKKGKK